MRNSRKSGRRTRLNGWFLGHLAPRPAALALLTASLSSTITRLRRSALVRGGLVVGAGILIGNITGFVRVAITAYLLGTHVRADALAVSTGLADTLNNIIINTLLVAFVPMLMLRPSHERLAVFARAGRLFAWILAGVSVLAALYAPQLISLLGPGLAAEQKHTAIVLLEILAPGILFSGASGIFAALLYTERRFVAPATYQLCLNGATIVCALLFWKAIGEYAFAAGYTAGAAIQLGVTWYASRDLRASQPEPASIPSGEILSKPGMYLLYAGLMSANMVLARAFATHAGSGMAAALDYSMRCLNVVIAYLVYPIANSLMPEIARLRAAGETTRAYRLMSRSVGLMAIASVISCGVGLLLRTPAIAILFQRGSFTAESTLLVASVFVGLAPSLIGWTLMDLISRCCFALDRPRLPLFAALVPVSVNGVFLAVLRWRGQLGDPVLLGLGASCGLLAGFAVLFAMARMVQSNLRSAS